MSSSSSSERRRKVYVAGYSSRDDEHDIKKAFKKYGKIDDISWKGRFCFVVSQHKLSKTFRESKDAERAIRKLHKESLHGHTLVVEFARSRGTNDGSCYNCNKKGHFARDCPKRRKASSSSSSSSQRSKKKTKKKKASSSSSSSKSKKSESKDKSRSRSGSKSKSKGSKSKESKSKSAGKEENKSKSGKSSRSESESKNGKKK